MLAPLMSSSVDQSHKKICKAIWLHPTKYNVSVTWRTDRIYSHDGSFIEPFQRSNCLVWSSSLEIHDLTHMLCLKLFPLSMSDLLYRAIGWANKKTIKIAIICRQFHWRPKLALCITTSLGIGIRIEQSELNVQLADTRATFSKLQAKICKRIIEKAMVTKKFGTWPKLIWKIIRIIS